MRYLDLDILERLPAEHGGVRHRRIGDMTWRVRFRSGRLDDGTLPYLVLPTEFQSVRDIRMGIRLDEYAGLLLDALVRDGTAAREGCLPPVLPLVVYNGERPWRPEPDPLAGLPSEVAEALARHQPVHCLAQARGAGTIGPVAIGCRLG